MARLSPSDLANAVFSRAPIGGYKHEEVNEILDRATETLEELLAENDEYRAQILRLRSELDGARGDERLLKETILSAQRAAELMREDARREAETIREEARRQAVADRTQAQKEAEALQDDVGRLQLLRQRLIGETRSLLEQMTHELNAVDKPTLSVAPRSTKRSEPRLPETRSPESRTSETRTLESGRAEPQTPTQAYPTRLPKNTKPLEPVIVEDENGEKWVS